MPESSSESQVWPSLELPPKMLETHRVYPHTFVRSALFSSRKFSGEATRATATEAGPIEIECLSNYSIQQVGGERMDQGDGEVYAWLLSRAYQRGLQGKDNARIFFTRGEALAELGRARGTQSFRLLDESLMRLYHADIIYSTPHTGGRTRLISSIEKPAKSLNRQYDYEIAITARVGDFFKDRDFKALLTEERAKMDDYFSKWLHAFYSSHNTPFQIFTETIKALADRQSMQESKWRTLLDTSLAELRSATGWAVCEVRENEDGAAKIYIRKSRGLVFERQTLYKHLKLSK